MKNIIGKFKALGKSYYSFLAMNAGILATVSIIQIFVNTFILKAGVAIGGISPENVALLYNTIAYGAQPFFMVLAVTVCRRWSPRNSQKIGFLAYAVCFIYIIIFGAKAALNFWLIALNISCAAGFYYVSYAFQIIEYTTDENRDAASGVTTTASSVINLIFPLAAGLLLGAFAKGDFTGYRILFAGMLVIIALSFYGNTRLTPLRNTFDPSDKKSHLGQVAKGMLTDKKARLVLSMTFLKGLRAGTLTSFIDILIFAAAMNESVNSINSTVAQVLAIFTAMLYGAIITVKRRKKSIAISTSIVLLASIPLFFAGAFIDSGNTLVYVVFLIIFNAANKSMGIFITEPVMNIYYSIIPAIPALRGNAGEVHTFNEFFLAAGEVTGLLTTILLKSFFPGSMLVSAIAIAVLTASQYLCAVIVGKIQKM